MKMKAEYEIWCGAATEVLRGKFITLKSLYEKK